MDEINLDALDRDQLAALHKNIGKKLASYDQRKRAEALKAVTDLAREHGFSLALVHGSTY
jgi:DNA-binding protein H-NS